MKHQRYDADTLAWLDDSLEHVREAGHTKTEALLRLVRLEVLEEVGLSGQGFDEDQVDLGN